MIRRPKVLSGQEAGVRNQESEQGSGNGIDEIQGRRRTPHAARDFQAKLRVTVKPLNRLVQPMNEVGKDSFSSLIARVNDTIVVRVPLR